MTRPIRIAHLEVSGRMTGKTERLTNVARQLAAAGETVVYVICSRGLLADSRLNLPGVTVIVDTDPAPLGIDPEKAIWIYDEFDSMQSVQVRSGGYYATTVSHLREAGAADSPNDVLVKLLKANGHVYQRCMVSDYLKEFVRDHRAVMSPANFRRSILGEFQA